MKTSIVLSVVAILLAASTAGLVLFGQSAQAPLSGAAGPNVSFHTFFGDDATIGGNRFATTSQGSVTYTAASIVNSKLIEHNAEAATTATLPTNALLSSAGFLPTVGDTRQIFIHASTTLITLAGSTGVTLSSASTSKNISANSTGILTCIRLGATEGRFIKCLLTAD